MANATLYINKKWFDANAEKFQKTFNEIAETPNDKDTTYMINLEDMAQNDQVFGIFGGALTVEAASPIPDSKKNDSAVYLSLEYLLDNKHQMRLMQWLIKKLNTLGAAMQAVLYHDDSVQLGTKPAEPVSQQ